MNAVEKFERRAEAVNSLLCVGLDSDHQRLPAEFQREALPQFAFNRWIIRETHPFVSVYKPNIAFYEARGEQGWQELRLTLGYLRERHPDILTICDAKRADIGNTNRGYVEAIFDHMGFDAITLHPYLGREALLPFLEREDKGCIVLCRTSNSGAGEFQDLPVGGKPLWQVIAESVSGQWNTNNNCMMVVGATYPEELKRVREIAGDMTLLVPGIGAQGGNLDAALAAGLNNRKRGMMVSASRSIIFDPQPATAAATLRDAINVHR